MEFNGPPYLGMIDRLNQARKPFIVPIKNDVILAYHLSIEMYIGNLVFVLAYHLSHFL